MLRRLALIALAEFRSGGIVSMVDSKSVITTPSGGQALLDKGFDNVSGLAWSGRGRIKQVEQQRHAIRMYELPRYGNVSLLRITDCHAQLLPIYFREPNAAGLCPAPARRPDVCDNLFNAEGGWQESGDGRMKLIIRNTY